MFRKPLSLILIGAIIANLALICVGHSHGPGDSQGGRCHVHLFDSHHDHGHSHDHLHADHSHDHDRNIDYKGTSLEFLEEGHSSDNHQNVLYVVDFDWTSAAKEKDLPPDQPKFAPSSIAGITAAPKAFSPSVRKASDFSEFAPAHFLNSIRIQL